MPVDPTQRRKIVATIVYLLTAAIVLVWANDRIAREQAARRVPYSAFLVALEGGRVESAHVREDEIEAVLRPAADRPPNERERVVATRLPGVDDDAIVAEMRAKGVTFEGTIAKTPWWKALLLGWLLPFGVLFLIYGLVVRRAAKGVSGPMTFGKSRAKVYDLNQDKKVTFGDVAGVDEAKAELVEIVRFLREPERYRALGARPPKGVLLVGPPGTGKTLLARAVAGEAEVPFFSLSGSEFVEMFVGVGAARVRDLFEQAKKRAPCIVFIDELDAVGKSRATAGAYGGHEEREQTLNQLLVEIDGFDPDAGVVILAATNRPEILDRALLRAGRFDRQVVVDRPDVRGREAILAVHARRLPLAPDVDLALVARRTPGMAGADLANVVNEAALAAARRDSRAVGQRDFEEAVDRIQLGLEKQGRVMTPEERRRVAYHEAGHALVALSVEHADPVHRVTIIPRTIGALGVTLQLPAQERYLMTRAELVDRICVMMGGRSAEELACGDVSTGAENDLERATETARQMVRRFGMSDALGPLTWGGGATSRFLDPSSMSEVRTFSEETARVIDAEIRAIVEREHRRARAILAERRVELERLAERLQSEETLDRPALEALVARPSAARRGESVVGAREEQRPLVEPEPLRPPA